MPRQSGRWATRPSLSLSDWLADPDSCLRMQASAAQLRLAAAQERGDDSDAQCAGLHCRLQAANAAAGAAERQAGALQGQVFSAAFLLLCFFIWVSVLLYVPLVECLSFPRSNKTWPQAPHTDPSSIVPPLLLLPGTWNSQSVTLGQRSAADGGAAAARRADDGQRVDAQ